MMDLKTRYHHTRMDVKDIEKSASTEGKECITIDAACRALKQNVHLSVSKKYDIPNLQGLVQFSLYGWSADTQ